MEYHMTDEMTVTFYNMDIKCCLESDIKQCCCNCKHRLTLKNHCWHATKDPSEHEGCQCKPTGLYVCDVFNCIDNDRICQITTEHSIGCECYDPINKVKETEDLNI